MTTSEILPVSPGTIGNHPCLTVDGRALYKTLGVKRDFTTWIKSRIEKYDFIEGQDFEIDSPILVNQRNGKGGDRRSQEYTLSLDMGKELCMVENNEKGKLTRRYFIACERKAIEQQPTLSAEDRVLLSELRKERAAPKALPVAEPQPHFLPDLLPAYERDIEGIIKQLERMCTLMIMELTGPRVMLMSDYARNKELLDVSNSMIAAAKNACGTGYFMLQAARRIFAAMK